MDRTLRDADDSTMVTLEALGVGSFLCIGTFSSPSGWTTTSIVASFLACRGDVLLIRVLVLEVVVGGCRANESRGDRETLRSLDFGGTAGWAGCVARPGGESSSDVSPWEPSGKEGT